MNDAKGRSLPRLQSPILTCAMLFSSVAVIDTHQPSTALRVPKLAAQMKLKQDDNRMRQRRHKLLFQRQKVGKGMDKFSIRHQKSQHSKVASRATTCHNTEERVHDAGHILRHNILGSEGAYLPSVQVVTKGVSAKWPVCRRIAIYGVESRRTIGTVHMRLWPVTIPANK
ncbi:hypothetical protein DEU56DRAFT_760088 [Suillus clintonianus]|uniref:uncharacterized protein n=1 Tax=Suillus clintonianus TaxID=1904413 RepID=UPI001B86F8E2|nr:uncharacterized protein DEU56DRAFT_760088 [Suillus clintonianus]KAG2123274.1 hypothetical protein DEU56DRAFT_760088 [Suillus clintonianus]